MPQFPRVLGLTWQVLGIYGAGGPIRLGGRSVWRALPDNTSRSYRSRDVSQILGLSRRQLQYWAQTDLVRPSAHTEGGHHRYSFQDLVALKAARRLIDAGVSVQRIRRSIQALRKILPSVHQPLAELVLVATGDVVLVFREGTAFDAVSGQEWVFEIAQLVREIDAWRDDVAALPPRARAGAQDPGARKRKQA